MKDEGGCMFDIMKARSLGYAGGVVFGGIVCFASIYVSFLYESIRLSSVLFVALYFAMLAFVLISKFKNEYTIAEQDEYSFLSGACPTCKGTLSISLRFTIKSA